MVEGEAPREHSGMVAPVPIAASRTAPRYPEVARLRGLEAHTTLKAVVHKNGNVGEITVVRTRLNTAGADPEAGETVEGYDKYGFGAAARDAVRTWRFQPATLDGAPVEAAFDVVIDFVLEPPKQPLEAGMGGVSNPTIIEESKTAPVYPEKARRDHVAGRSVLQALVRKDGTVGDVMVLRTTLLFEDGSTRIVEPPAFGDDYGFGAASVATVRTWRYRPARFGGEPVDVYFTVVVDFALESPRPGEAPNKSA